MSKIEKEHLGVGKSGLGVNEVNKNEYKYARMVTKQYQ